MGSRMTQNHKRPKVKAYEWESGDSAGDAFDPLEVQEAFDWALEHYSNPIVKRAIIQLRDCFVFPP
jgi:hypothetical protein